MNSNQSKPAKFWSFISYLLIVFVIVVNLSCKTKTEAQNETSNESLPEEKNIVETVVLEKQDFTREIISNGKLAAILKAELYFKNPGIIETVKVHNGESVSVNVELARLQNDEYRFNVEKAQVTMEKAEIDRLDALLSMGYKTGSENISKEHLKIADIRSGYNQAKIQLAESTQQLDNISLKAPFSGKVEGLKQKSFEKADLSKPFCTLINDNRFTIEFPLLETEFNEINTGQKVTISPIAGAKQTEGNITEINPRIDENGLVWVKAEVTNPGGYLEGMNVKVSIKRAISGQLVVPKQAVVLRQNREVLFRFTKGTAYWTYINVLDENEHQYSVVAAEGATLELGDTVIISNNLNLAHESEVEMK
jgi:membrane fusion protein (multidrug efflux system)